ncbi:MAG: methyl-accepting chemotaxis protein [Deltaproteobacteria bacterium]|nr:methyl-accepting chemotaxis protein [Deltaproteobacteria bacterium]
MKLSVGKKIGGGFLIVLVLLTVVGVIGFFGSRYLVKEAIKLADFHEHEAELIQMEVDHLNWANKVATQLADPNCKKIEVEVDEHKCNFGKWFYGEGRKEIEGHFPTLAPILSAMEKPHHDLHRSVEEINAVMAGGARTGGPSLETVAGPAEMGEETGMAAPVQPIVSDARRQAGEIFRAKTLPLLEEVKGKFAEARQELAKNALTAEGMINNASSINTILAIAAIIAIILGAAIAFFIRRDITRVLYRLIGELDNNSGQITDASTQVSTSSQQLAELASEQAASLEETSASMEEMASMTKQNADNAQQAARLMDETKTVVDKTGDQMEQMAGSMNRIKGQGEEVGKIVKTIDEIAFQTNLLALNAAVEAARAGEAGAGFAVVADEVRNLAQRAAEAAKNTSALIEETIKNIKEGHELVTHTKGAFQDVATSANKVAELVGEIAEASREQAQGISQINTAVTEMDKAVQNNAASAEESASAAEELGSQAQSLKDMVTELADYVGTVNGGRLSSEKKGKGSSIISAAKKLIPLRAVRKAEPGSRPQSQQPRTQAKGTSKKPVKPEDVIPFEDDGGSFKDF